MTGPLDTVLIEGVPVIIDGRARTTEAYLDCVARKRADRARHPVLATHVNGQVLFELGRSAELRKLFGYFQLISMDGQPAVLISRLWRKSFVERVAVTDHVHDVIRAGLATSVRHYFLGARPDISERAMQALRRLYPDIVVAGSRPGHFDLRELPAIAEEIQTSGADIVWICLGTPLEQRVAAALSLMATGPAIFKTAGGVLDFISGKSMRAPLWMQRVGLEWLFRLMLEPRRLFVRYFSSNAWSFWRLATMRPAYARLGTPPLPDPATLPAFTSARP